MNQAKLSQKIQSFEPLNIDLQPREFHEIVQSKYSSKYLGFFSEIKLPNMSEYIEKLKVNRIEYSPNKQEKETMIIKQIEASSKYQTVVIHVHFGPFILTLNLLNKRQKSIIHYAQKIGHGASGSIYNCHYHEDSFVIKCIICLNYHTKKNPLISVIQEYCFFKICSVLQVGPKIKNFMGFDLILYQDCIQFPMQKCIKVQKISSDLQISSLKQCLLILHYFHIIHFDIKPDNISYSPFFKKFIFLDFGFTKIINQNLGYMRSLHFIGTVGFCSEQMSEAYLSQQSRMVDPYYNDAVGLERSIIYFKKSRIEARHSEENAESYFHNNIESIQEDEQSNKNNVSAKEPSLEIIDNFAKRLTKQIEFHRLLYQIFVLQIEQFEKIRIQSIIQSHGNKIAKFLMSIYPKSNVKHFYKTYYEKNSQFNSQILHSHFKKNPLMQGNSSNQDDMYQQRIVNIFNYQINFVTYSNRRAHFNQQNIKERLMIGSSQFISIEEYYVNFIEYCAFNKANQNIPKKDKIDVCSILLKDQAKQICKDSQAIKKAINFLIKYSITKPYSYFKHCMFSQCFQQSCILNNYQENQIAQLIKQIKQLDFSFHEKIQLFIQIDRSLQWLENRLIYHNEVDQLQIKSCLSKSLRGLILEQTKQKSLSRQQKLIINYFHIQYFIQYQFDELLALYLKGYQKLIKTGLNKPQRKWIQFCLISKKIKYNINKKWNASLHYFNFQRYSFQKSKKFLQPFHLILIQYYFFLNNRLDSQKIIASLKYSLGQEYNLFRFNLMSLKMKKQRLVLYSNDYTQYNDYASYLIDHADHCIKNRVPLHRTVFTELLLMKFDYCKKNLHMKYHNTYQQICLKIKEHSNQFQKWLISIFSWKKTPTKRESQCIKLYLVNLFKELDKQKLKQILSKILNKTQFQQIQQIDCNYLIYIQRVRYTKKILTQVKQAAQLMNHKNKQVEKALLSNVEYKYPFADTSDLNRSQQINRKMKIYLQLIKICQKDEQKRRNYAYQFYQIMQKYQQYYQYFRQLSKILYYILDSIKHRNQGQEQTETFRKISRHIIKLGSYLYVNYSINNFIIFNNNIRTFIVKCTSEWSEKTVNIFYCQMVPLFSQNPYLILFMSFLLPYSSNKKKLLIQISKHMGKLSMQARRTMLKFYLKAVISISQKKTCRHLEIFYEKRYNLFKLQKRIQKKIVNKIYMKNFSLKAKQKFWNYFNNFDAKDNE